MGSKSDIHSTSNHQQPISCPPILITAITTILFKAFGDLVYPIMLGGDKPGQDKADKFKEVMGWMNDFVAEDKFVGRTNEMTIADIALIATYSTIKATGGVGGIDFSDYPNIEAWYEKCIKLVPNYEKANGEGATAFGEWYKSKC